MGGAQGRLLQKSWANTKFSQSLARRHGCPREAIQQVAETLGRLHQGVLVFDSVDESSVLMDCGLFDWIREGKTFIEQYVENHPPVPGTAEHELLEAGTLLESGAAAGYHRTRQKR